MPVEPNLTDVADTAARRLIHDIRTALPNSVRVTSNGSAVYLEYLETVAGGRYNSTTTPAGCMTSGNCTALTTIGDSGQRGGELSLSGAGEWARHPECERSRGGVQPVQCVLERLLRRQCASHHRDHQWRDRYERRCHLVRGDYVHHRRVTQQPFPDSQRPCHLCVRSVQWVL